MTHPEHLGINPRFIEEYLVAIASKLAKKVSFLNRISVGFLSFTDVPYT